jgi:hypothetical protein
MHDAVVPAEVEHEGPVGDAARRAAAEISYVRKNHFVRPEHQDGVGVQLGARYDGSPIIVADGAPPPDIFPQTYDEYVPSGLPGGRAPHLWLDDAARHGKFSVRSIRTRLHFAAAQPREQRRQHSNAPPRRASFR